MKVYVLLKHIECGDRYESSVNTSIVGVYSDVPSVPNEEKDIKENGRYTQTIYEVVESTLTNPYSMQA